MPLKHFARHLRVARFVSPNHSKLPQTVKKKKAAEARQQQRVGAGTVRHSAVSWSASDLIGEVSGNVFNLCKLSFGMIAA